MCPGINKSEWTETEDDVLLMLKCKYPGNWTKISHYLKGRPPNAFKLRWRYLERKMLKRERENSGDLSKSKTNQRKN